MICFVNSNYAVIRRVDRLPVKQFDARNILVIAKNTLDTEQLSVVLSEYLNAFNLFCSCLASV